MKLNQATDYAFRMVLHMAVIPAGKQMPGGELSTSELIPERFLLKIMRSLIKAGIMKSYRGVEGGFALNKDPKEITLLDVIRAIEGDTYLQKCLYDPESCNKSCQGMCAVNEAFGVIQETLTQQLEGVNFADLAARERTILEHAKETSQIQACDCSGCSSCK